MLAVALWFGLVRDTLVDLAPDAVRCRLVAHVRLSRREWLLVPPAALVGAATHLGWDAFTHADRWGVALVPWLQADHGALPGYKWAQYVCGVVGLAVVCWSAVAHLRAQPATPRAPRPRWTNAVLPAVAMTGAAAGLASAASRVPQGLHAMAFQGVTDGGLVTVLAGCLVCLAWRARERSS